MSRPSSTAATCGGQRATLVGTPGVDHLSGTDGHDVIVGLEGNDVINGRGGTDLICGGTGDDRLLGGRGPDALMGGSGNDVLAGGRGNDLLAGEAGRDRLNGGPGVDTCSQNTGTGPLSGCETVVTRATLFPPGHPLPTGAAAAALVRRSAWEPRPDNLIANHTVPDVPVPWAMTEAQLYWTKWIANRARVTGQFTGTTDEIIQWGAYKWGIDENTIRAVAVQESDWHMSFVGDNGASFGITQVRDHYASTGLLDFGGYPWTQKATALNVDFYGAWIRSCLNGAFYDGSPWLYGGRRITGDLWGCVGAWNSGSWYDVQARRYIAGVKASLAARRWRNWR